jgi:hypothetical protein
MNLEPYFRLRELLEPNTGGGYWNVPSGDCYVGLTPRWYVTVWGYHYYEHALIEAGHGFYNQALFFGPAFPNLLRTFGVSHVLSRFAGPDPRLTLIDRRPDTYVYRVEGAARVRVVRAARRIGNDAHAADRLREPTFDPDNEIVLLDAPDSIRPAVDATDNRSPGGPGGRAAITYEDTRQLVVDAVAPEDSFLLLADMYYPGWRAEVDGVATPIYRANVSLRGIALPKGQHTVRFTYEPSSFFRGLWISSIALSALFLWFGAAAYRAYA